MPFIIADRVRETSTTVGTGSIALGGAVIGYQSFDAVMDTADTTFYVFADQAGGPNWEVGIGTFTAPSTLARTTIISSSNGGSIVNFGSGTKDVFISLPASKTNVDDQPNVIEVNSSTAALRITQTGTGNALLVEDSANPDSSPFVIDASGNVGVGTTTPAVPLDVAGTIRSVAATPFYNLVSGSTDMGGIYSPDTSSVNILARSSKSLVFMSGGVAERMRIDASGNVGIATSTPTAPLDVNGNVAITGTARRITGDFSNATLASRIYFQTTTAGGGTSVAAIPNATGANSAFNAFGSPDPGNSSFFQLRAGSDTGDARLTSGIIGTGTFLPMTFYTGASERMRIDTSGNVGIGTSSPTSRLTVAGGVSPVEIYQNSASIRFSSSPNRTNNYYLGANISDSVDAGFIIGYGTDIGTGTPRIIINSSGNVGVGGSPGTDSRLRIEGTESRLRSVNTTSGAIAYFGAMSPNEARAWSVTGTDLTLGTSNTERMRINASGNVGIGTASPGYRLDIPATGAVAANLGGVLVGANGTDITANIAGLAVKVPTANPVQFFTSNLERMVINSAGNVGIGTSSPGYRLHAYTSNANSLDGIAVMGGAGATRTIEIRPAMTAGANNNIVQAGDSGIIFSASALNSGAFVIAPWNSSTSGIRIDGSTGNVGIGTGSMSHRLEVVSSSGDCVGSLRSAASGAGIQRLIGSTNSFAAFNAVISTDASTGQQHWYIGGNGTQNTLVFMTGGANERARIDAAGNFLVGTTSAAGRIASIGGGNIGVYASSTANHAVFGDGTTTGFYGVYGASTNTSYGGVIGYHNSYNAFGILGYVGYGLYSNASIWVNGTVYTSDARLKENVAPLEGSLAKVAALNPVSFDWKANSFRGASSDFGLIAQEVEQVIPECVFETAVPQRTPEMKHAPTLEEELGTYKGVDYGRFIPLLIAAVKELSAENNTLKARVAALENR